MPSDPPRSAKCYCGASRLTLDGPPITAAYCHCGDCRRWTGAAFAAFERAQIETQLPVPQIRTDTVSRWHCATCGSPLAATFAYLPDQIYVPVGILDDAADIRPALHSHADNTLPWLHISDDLPRASGTARGALRG